MSYYDGLCPIYTFRLSIEREDRELLDVTVSAKGEPAELNRAKETIQRLLNENTPKIEPGPAPAPVLEVTGPEPPEDSVPEPEEDIRHRVKGVVKMICPACGGVIHAFLMDYEKSLTCKCGHVIDLTDPTIARYEYDCPKCGKHRYGRTNLEDTEIEDRCGCGETVKLEWDKQGKRYTIKNSGRRDGQLERRTGGRMCCW